MSEHAQPTSPRHEEQQGPASLQQPGPAAGYGVQELEQPVKTQNADEVMEQHQREAFAKRHPQ